MAGGLGLFVVPGSALKTNICITCRLTLPLTDFAKQPGYKYGRINKCRKCCRDGSRDTLHLQEYLSKPFKMEESWWKW